MKNEPYISMIMPVYNSDKTLEKSIECVLNQSLHNIELIIIDDGSRDNSKSIIEHYAKLDSRVKAIFQQNLGVSVARNRGIEIANGEYIGFVDSDDLMELNMLETLYSETKKNFIDVVCCGMYLEYSFGRRSLSPCDEKIVITSIQDKRKFIYTDAYIDAWRKGFSECWNKIYKKSIIKDNNILFDTTKKYGEDHEFNLKVFTCSKNIVILPDKLYIYNRRNSSSATKNYINNMLDIALEGYKVKLSFLKKWNIMSKDNIDKINYQFILTIDGCMYNEAIGNGQLTKKERADRIGKIKSNDVVTKVVNSFNKKELSFLQKMKLFKIGNVNKNVLLVLYLLKSNCVNIAKNILKIKKLSRI